MSIFSKEEIKFLLKELNDISPEFMLWEDDGYYEVVVCLRAKNYILWDGKKLKIKGSALRDTKKEKFLLDLIKSVIDFLVFDKGNILEIYNNCIKEVMDIKDMTRYSFKKTITESVLNPERTNEQRVLDALEGTEFSEGDKRYFFFKDEKTLCLVEKFDGAYDKMKLVKRIYDTMCIFDSVIDISVLPKYHLKKNQKLLQELIVSDNSMGL